MKLVSYPTALALSWLLLLWGCAGAPADNGNAPNARPADTNAAPPSPPPKPSMPPTSQRPATPDPASEGMTAYELQERLTRLGYKPGAVDGIAGAKTIEALKKYQSDNKLPPTGNMDADTIRKLRSEK
jgi:peptidoglycan hydrolase-like protein with peptidoglycan-binding domain